MKKLEILLSEILQIPEQEINDTTSPETVASWDSYIGLLMVSELETNFNIKFTMEEVISVRCVKDIKEILTTYGIKFNE